MRPPWRPAALLPLLAGVWLTGSNGVTLAPWAAVATAVVAAVAATPAWVARWPRHGGLVWLAGLTVWCGVAAATLPVARAEAAWLVAIAVVACLLGLASSTPRGAVASRWTVVATGLACAGWLVSERVITGARPGGPVEDPNRTAVVAAFALALLPGLKVRWQVRAAAALVLVAGVVASGSRAVLLALLGAAVVWTIRGASPGLRRFAVGVAVLALVGLLVRIGLDRDPLRFERVRIWGVAVRTALAEMPLGAGPGGYRDAALRHNFPRSGEFARYHRIPALAENDLLQTAGSLGLPGLALAAGLSLSLLRRSRRRPELALVLTVLAVTSALHSQLAVPLVAWTAALAVGAAWGRVRLLRHQAPPGAIAGVCFAVVATASSALMWPRGGLLPDSATWLDRAARIVAESPDDPAALARAEAFAQQATTARPRHPEAWRRLGDVRLMRASLLGDGNIAEEATADYRQAAEMNPLDVWALVGLGRARALLGEGRAAQAALSAAVTLEPNCVPAWLERSRVELELGEVEAARRSLRAAQAALDSARGASFVSSYELAMATADPVLLARLRTALEPRR